MEQSIPVLAALRFSCKDTSTLLTCETITFPSESLLKSFQPPACRFSVATGNFVKRPDPTAKRLLGVVPGGYGSP
ncbi:MAG: hypothetical protein ACOZF2_04280 [Thermodesulfobacteriota bacterium]